MSDPSPAEKAAWQAFLVENGASLPVTDPVYAFRAGYAAGKAEPEPEPLVHGVPLYESTLACGAEGVVSVSFNVDEKITCLECRRVMAL